MRATLLGLTALIAAAATLSAQAASPAAQPAADSSQPHATVSLSDSGLIVLFPRAMSPDSITREMTVPDLFSGYEWRIILLGRASTLVTAFVIPVNDSLIVHRYKTIKAAFDAGGFRTCARNEQVLDCDRLARGLIRDVDGRLEIGILDAQWLSQVFRSGAPMVRVVVVRAREILWTEDVSVKVHVP